VTIPTPRPEAPEALLPFTPEWADRFREAINNDARYRAESKRWTWPLALILDAAPALGFDADVAIDLELKGGTCNAARIVPAAATKAPFKFRGPYGIWKRIVRGELDPVMAATRGELHFEGSLVTLLMHVASARALVACAQQVPTRFPDE
jgi:putative sterol carrier protein